MITITVNGVNRSVPSGTFVEECLMDLEVNIETVVVECDGIILKRDEYGTTTLEEGSVLEVIRFIGGG